MSSSAPQMSSTDDLTAIEPDEGEWNTVSNGKILPNSQRVQNPAPAPLVPAAQPAVMCWSSLFETPRLSPSSRPKSPEPSQQQALNVIARVEPFVILQGLIHCAPLANLLRSIPLSLLESLERAPFLLAFHKLFSQFYETIAGRHLNEEPVIPEELVDAIRHGSGTDAFQGEQEDAQEFLTFILDHLHQEFALNKELLHWQFSETTEALFRSESLQEEGGWMEVGPKQRVSETRTMAQTETPISFLFAGQFRSTVRRPRIKDSITFEPFNCLPLEVHHRHISSIEEALQSLSRPERIEESGITKYVTLSRLPMILIIQLKRFVFNQEHGRIEKVNKHIAYPEKLVLPRSCYTMISQHAGSNPTYRLTAVVYHHGRTAEGGHYTADVRKSFKMDEHWQRINDASIQAVSLEAVLGERRHSDSSAYLLIYQRYKDMKHQL